MFLLTIQFPFADMRKFLPDSGRLVSPGWPFPSPNTEFVRGFGTIRARRSGGVEGWVGENEICEADRVMAFCQSLNLRVPESTDDQVLPIRCAFRRLYFDGWAVGKYEVGLVPTIEGAYELNQAEMRLLIEHFLSLQVAVRKNSKEIKQTRLAYAGKPISQAYLSATTRHGMKDKLQEWWVSAGTPIMFFESHNDALKVPYWMKPIKLPVEERFQIGHYFVPYQGQDFRMWYLSKEDGAQNNQHNYNRARALRITVMRLYAEHETLRLVLRNLMNKRITIQARTPQSDDLQAYLNQAISRISRLERSSSAEYNTDIVEIARESFDSISPGQRETLLSTLDSMEIRKNIFNKVQKYANEWTNVTIIGEQIMGDSYNNYGQAGAIGPNAKAEGNVFNQFGANASPAELADLAKELAVLRTEMKKQATEPDQDVSVGEVAQAQVEAGKGNGQKALEHLKKAGEWALDTATKIGVTVATAALKEALGIK